jgi:threonine/homoserine/homoserine lactone efflux protein
MFEPERLLGFVAVVFVLVIAPGPNTMIILAQALGSRRAGFATVAGVELGTLFHTMAAAIGVAALLATSTLAFNIVKFTGVIYLIIVGIRTTIGAASPTARINAAHPGAAFRRALATSVLNPKTAVFFLAFLPQFVNPERGSVFVQFVILGLIVSLVGLCVGATLAVTASAAADTLQRHAGFARWQHRAMGAALVMIALCLAAT